jgi:hypothetical protein
MATDKKLSYITKKIVETQVAILICYTSELLRIPNTVIKTLHVDTDGHIWFFVDRPDQLLSQFEPSFPVEMNYFKKGQGYYMNIRGNGKLITDIEEIAHLSFLGDNEKLDASVNHVLMRVKILRADYHLFSDHVANTTWEKIKAAFTSLFSYSENRIFDFTSTYH